MFIYFYHLKRFLQPQSDGYLENKRIRIATGLAIIHIGQYFSSHKTKDWQLLFSIATKYLTLAQCIFPYFWLSKMGFDKLDKMGYTMDIYFIEYVKIKFLNLYIHLTC